MRRLFLASLLCMSAAGYAAEDVECAHKKGAVQCTFNIEMIIVAATINGGECPVPRFQHHAQAGSKFVIPGSLECYYARSLTLTTHAGKTYRFVAM